MRAGARLGRGLALTLGLLAVGWGARAAADGGFVGVFWENDKFGEPFRQGNQDRHYTQGTRVVWLGGTTELTNSTLRLNQAVPVWGYTLAAAQLGWTVLGQNMYTPGDLKDRNLIKSDRPYAGWLYTGAIYLRRGVTAGGGAHVLESFMLDLGVIGPPSLAKEAQEAVHRWYASDAIPRGWRNQLNTEPGLLLRYGRLWRWRPTAADDAAAAWLDLIPHVGAAAGNIQVFAAAGATLRVGWNLPDDFGPQGIDSTASPHGGKRPGSREWGIYGFGRVEGRAVAWNMFLDGNAFSSSHSVAKEPFVADLAWGVAAQLTRRFEISYTRVVRTAEFVKQDGQDTFGSIFAKWKFDF